MDDLARRRARIGSPPAIVRDFAIADQEQARALVLGGLAQRWGATFDPSFNHDLDDISRNYLARGAEFVVVEVGPRLGAVGALIDEGDGCGRLVRISVEPSLRRSGLGRRVVSELVTRARRRGMTVVRVLTDKPWIDAVVFYSACGFTEVFRDEADVHFELRLP